MKNPVISKVQAPTEDDPSQDLKIKTVEEDEGEEPKKEDDKKSKEKTEADVEIEK